MRGATPKGIASVDDVFTSIHAPHAWGDCIVEDVPVELDGLQSTPHMRGATRRRAYRTGNL